MFKELQSHLIAKGYTADPNYIQSTMVPKIKQIMTHVFHMILTRMEPIFKKSNTFELLEFSFVMDTDLKLWLIEVNPIETLKTKNKNLVDFYHNLLTEQFQIVHAFLKSRLKRIILLVNKI